jgi:hypothetical protein
MGEALREEMTPKYPLSTSGTEEAEALGTAAAVPVAYPEPPVAVTVCTVGAGQEDTARVLAMSEQRVRLYFILAVWNEWVRFVVSDSEEFRSLTGWY